MYIDRKKENAFFTHSSGGSRIFKRGFLKIIKASENICSDLKFLDGKILRMNFRLLLVVNQTKSKVTVEQML